MEDDIEASSSGGGLLPVALAVLAIVLGGAGLYFGLTANQRINPLSDSMDAGSTSAAQLQKDIAGLQTQLAELRVQNSEFTQALDRVRLYGNQNEKTVKIVASSVKENREEIIKIAGRLNEMASSGVRSAPPAPPSTTPVATANAVPVATTSTGPATEAPVAAEVSSAGKYKIVSGDNFGKIASKLGVSLQALLDANPAADPRKLQIGQEINIPSN